MFSILTEYYFTAGFIGPLHSSNVVTSAKFLSDLKIPQITPSATAVELRDKYKSLLKTASADDKQSKVTFVNEFLTISEIIS